MYVIAIWPAYISAQRLTSPSPSASECVGAVDIPSKPTFSFARVPDYAASFPLNTEELVRPPHQHMYLADTSMLKMRQILDETSNLEAMPSQAGMAEGKIFCLHHVIQRYSASSVSL